MNTTREFKLQAFGRLLDVIDRLRIECPWDRKQTFDSLRPNTIEEVYELCDATLKHDWPNVCKELGDVLEHVLFYAKMGDEQGSFDIADICNREADKLIFRHPHIYGEQKAEGETTTAEQVLQSWEQIKLKEKGGNKTVLSGVPQSLPALIKAYRIGEKAANVGFDWEDKQDVWSKVKEEINEFEAEVIAQSEAIANADDTTKQQARQAMEEEFGDLLFSLVNAARLYKLNPDTALERTNQKFITRFNYVEAKAKEQGKALKELTLQEMDELWEKAKREGEVR